MKHIIIADDSRTARMFIRRCLEIIGLNEASFIEVTNGKEALNKVREKKPDLLVTDLNMPVMDGETLLKWLKSSPTLASMPILVITSAGNPAKEAELLSKGILGVITKPVSPAKLINVLGPLVN